MTWSFDTENTLVRLDYIPINGWFIIMVSDLDYLCQKSITLNSETYCINYGLPGNDHSPCIDRFHKADMVLPVKINSFNCSIAIS